MKKDKVFILNNKSSKRSAFYTHGLKKACITGMSLLLCLLMGVVKAQVSSNSSPKEKLYHPDAPAAKDIQRAVRSASQSGKHVFIQLGGNWCTWCLAFHRFVQEDPELDSVLESNYVVYHLNYSPENKNAALLKQFQYPQRFGFPCFIILDQKGQVLHIQNSAYLEKGRSYDHDKVLTFFENWTVKALSDSTYSKALGL